MEEEQKPLVEQPMKTDKNTHVLTAIVVIIGVIIVGSIIAVIALYSKKPTSESIPVVTLNPIASTSPENVVLGGIEWHSIINAKPVWEKPVSKKYMNYIVDIYDIGSFLTGEYKGDMLALGTCKQSNQQGQYANSSFDSYYFIADKAGKAIAWWGDKTLNSNYACIGGGGVGEPNEDYDLHFENVLGLSATTTLAAVFPPELDISTTTIGKGSFNAATTFFIPNDKTYGNVAPTVLAQKDSVGRTILIPYTSNNLGPKTYVVQLPFGGIYFTYAQTNFMDDHDLPQLTWATGTKEIQSYKYGQYGYGWEDCYDNIPAGELPSYLVQSGTTIHGDVVYELLPATQFKSVYQCLFEKTKRYVYDDSTETGKYVETVQYDTFVTTHPMFFWYHPTGELMGFLRSDIVPPAEKAKPVVYLYPEHTEQVHVNVSPIGGIDTSIPSYGTSGWNVQADPQSHITTADGSTYPYLFWEGGKEGIVNTSKQGFVVAKADISKTLNEKLSAFGLNAQERKDFLEFWTPKLSQAPYYFITFISRSEIDRVSPMNISPKPDTVIRVLMDYKPLTSPIAVEPLPITPTERKGFTVVEWGGIVR